MHTGTILVPVCFLSPRLVPLPFFQFAQFPELDSHLTQRLGMIGFALVITAKEWGVVQRYRKDLALNTTQS